MTVRFKNVGPCSINKIITVRDMNELGERLTKYVMPGKMLLKWASGDDYHVMVDGTPQGLINIEQGDDDAEAYCRQGEFPPLT